MSLAEQSCVPCRGGVEPLGPQQAEALRVQVPDWQLTHEATRIERTFKFKNFTQALDFVNRIGDLAEEEGHHPDIRFGWGYATVAFYTHKIKGLHENDFVMAAKADEIYS